MEPVTYKTTKTTNLYYKISLVVYIFGFPNFWIKDLNLSRRFVKTYDSFTSIISILQYIFVLFEIAAFYTQHNLTEKQRSNLWLFGMSHPIFCFYLMDLTYHKKNIRIVLYNLTVALKEVYNDLYVEKQMIRNTVTYLVAHCFTCVMSMFMYFSDAYMDMVHENRTFTTVVTAYPEVTDRSVLANVARAVCNIIWCIFFTRILGLFMLVISISTCLSHQYKNLQSYFYSLNDIFERKDLSHKEMEDLYEKQFMVGITFHRDTLRYTRLTQTVLSEVFSGQIIFNVVMLVVLMAQMVNSERNLFNLCATAFTATAVLISTGFFMWNAGDVTVEASQLSTAMFYSGWHNCRGASANRIGKLVAITMLYAQRPVVLKGLGYIKLSYGSYIKIVKSSYSVFSVLF